MQRDNITLLCHRRPDGDTVGSAFALYYALRQLGKEVRVLCADPLPQQYRYLYGPDYTPSRVLDWPVEYVVAVDVASAELLGELEPKYGRMVDLCIDHHPSNTDYAALTCRRTGGCHPYRGGAAPYRQNRRVHLHRPRYRYRRVPLFQYHRQQYAAGGGYHGKRRGYRRHQYPDL